MPGPDHSRQRRDQTWINHIFSPRNLESELKSTLVRFPVPELGSQVSPGAMGQGQLCHENEYPQNCDWQPEDTWKYMRTTKDPIDLDISKSHGPDVRKELEKNS